MKRLTFPLAFLAFLALSLALSSCGDDGPAADQRSLNPADITVEKGPAAAILPIGGGAGGDGGQAIQTASTAVGITGTGYGKATAPADTAVVEFALSTWPKGFGPVTIACASGCTPRPTSDVSIGDLLAEETLRSVIDAVVAAGGDRDSINIKEDQQTLPYMYPQGQQGYQEPKVTGTLSVTVPEIENVPAVAQAGMDAVGALTEIDAQLTSMSVTYGVTDCAALRNAAGQAAAEDAADNARATADLLGINIGAIVGASNYIIQAGYQQPGESDCSVSGGSIAVSPGAGLIAPSTEVEVSAQISVTYAIE